MQPQYRAGQKELLKINLHKILFSMTDFYNNAFL